jgi:hypothetical protein
MAPRKRAKAAPVHGLHAVVLVTDTPVTVAVPVLGVTSLPPSLSASSPDTMSVFEKLHTNASNVQL